MIIVLTSGIRGPYVFYQYVGVRGHERRCRGGKGNLPITPEILNLVHEIAHELTSQDAKAVLLTGSHVRGEAYPESDVDILAIGDGPGGSHTGPASGGNRSF